MADDKLRKSRHPFESKLLSHHPLEGRHEEKFMKYHHISNGRRIVFAVILLSLFNALALPGYSFNQRLHTLNSLTPQKSQPIQNPARNISLSQEAMSGAQTSARLNKDYGRVPMSFEANEGQLNERVRFISRGSGYNLFLTETEAVLSLQKSAAHASSGARNSSASQQQVVSLSLLNTNQKESVMGDEKLPGRINYLTGNDPRQWRTNISAYKRVKYENVYPGIDLVYYGNQRELEYDFLVAPRVDPTQIRLSFKGATKLEVDEAGDLLLHTADGALLKQKKPVLYQEINGERREVEGDYMLSGANEVGFKVGAYDSSRMLVIDPVLVYATYFGGSGVDESYGIAVDSAGSAYLTGLTDSTDFPTTPGAFRRTRSVGEAFVLKLSPDGSSIVYGTFLGGSGNDIGEAIKVDAAGNAYVAGWTSSKDFPTRNAFQSTHHEGVDDIFFAKLNASGTDLLYSTYLGGNNLDLAHDLDIDSSGNAYLTGMIFSTDFPTTPGAFRRTPQQGGPSGDGFVTKINPSASGDSSLVYSTYFDSSRGIAVDSSGNAYVTGFNYASKLNATGSALLYRFDLNATGAKVGFQDVAVDAAGNAYLAGSVAQGSVQIQNGFQSAVVNSPDAVMLKLNPAGTGILYSTYLGGGGADYADAIVADSAGHAYVVGGTNSKDFPIKDALQASNGGGTDAFIMKINTNASGAASLIYSTYFGITYNESATGVAVDAAGSAYISGLVYTNTLPGIIHTGITSYHVMSDARRDALFSPFALKIADSSASSIQFSADSYSVSESTNSVSITVKRNGDVSAAASVEYATISSTASDRADFTGTIGTLHFAPGETSKSFTILLTDDVYVEGQETVNLILRNPSSGTALGTSISAVLTITDNDTAPSTTNPADDATFFVSQHYKDFLNREADDDGLQYWSQKIIACGTDAACINRERINVSAAFFVEAEFQETGYFVYRFYRSAYGRRLSFAEYTRDRNQINAGANLDASKQAFADEFVQQPEFIAKYPASMTGAEFIDALIKNVKDSTGVDLSSQRDAYLADYNSFMSRSRVLRLVVDNAALAQAEYNRAFVLAQYFGYLRRDVDESGYEFWLNVLNNKVPGNYKAMVCAFLTSSEYQLRFSANVTRNNSQCGS